jgi:hypothetical protein
VVPGWDHDHVAVPHDLRTLARVVVEQLNAEPALRLEPIEVHLLERDLLRRSMTVVLVRRIGRPVPRRVDRLADDESSSLVVWPQQGANGARPIARAGAAHMLVARPDHSGPTCLSIADRGSGKGEDGVRDRPKLQHLSRRDVHRVRQRIEDISAPDGDTQAGAVHRDLDRADQDDRAHFAVVAHRLARSLRKPDEP